MRDSRNATSSMDGPASDVHRFSRCSLSHSRLEMCTVSLPRQYFMVRQSLQFSRFENQRNHNSSISGSHIRRSPETFRLSAADELRPFPCCCCCWARGGDVTRIAATPLHAHRSEWSPLAGIGVDRVASDRSHGGARALCALYCVSGYLRRESDESGSSRRGE